ncbi:MAG: hypothetical protein ACRYHC_13860 [Janthinobacterium lividum]
MTPRLAAMALALSVPRVATAAPVTIDVRGTDGAPLADAVVTVEIAGRHAVQRGPYVMEQKAIAFQPHVLIVPLGATVSFPIAIRSAITSIPSPGRRSSISSCMVMTRRAASCSIGPASSRWGATSTIR